MQVLTLSEDQITKQHLAVINLVVPVETIRMQRKMQKGTRCPAPPTRHTLRLVLAKDDCDSVFFRSQLLLIK